MWNPMPWTLAVVVAAAATWAGAQISPVEPYWAIVTADQTNLHSGDMRQYYAVAKVRSGTPVRVDGEGGGWSRVAYPQGLTGFAPARDVKDLGDGTLEVIRPTALKALNLERGFGGSWQNLVPSGQELKPGDTIKAVETVARTDGSVAAWVIVPPANARGYIESNLLRRATPEEAARLIGQAGQPAGVAVPATPDAVTPAIQPPPASTDELVVPVPAQPDGQTPTAPAEAISLIDEIVVPGSDPAGTQTQPVTAPAPVQPVAAPTIDPAVTDQVMGQTEVVTPDPGFTEPLNQDGQPAVDISVPADASEQPVSVVPMEVVQGSTGQGFDQVVPSTPTPESLETLFDQVRRQPLMEAELDELASQFRRVRDGLSDSAIDRSLADRIDERLKVLDVMIDLRDRRAELADRQAALSASRVDVERRIADANARAGFTFVGQIVPSAVYDGVRLPKLYRVVSVDEYSSRTLAYVSDSEILELAQKVGRVVGLDGSIRIDPNLGVRVLTATRASVLRPD
jgi:hypothetical protein